ncbi:MAG: SDR family NAD(P)-dependent oxidoreductase [Candidatus Binatia bacterium]
MRALVTGIDGFVGGFLARALLARGAAVYGTVRTAGRRARLRDLVTQGLREPDVHAVDVEHAGAVEAAVAAVQPDALFHLAGLAFIPAAAANPSAAFRTNALGALHVLAAVQRHAPRCRVLIVGSADAYGAVRSEELPVREDCPLRPVSAYGASKAAADLLAAQWARGMDLDVVRVRPFNHTGPGQRAVFVCADFARQLVAIERGARPPRLEVGDLEPVRDFTDVRDVVAAYLAACERGTAGEAYNVCSGVGRSIASVLADLVAEAGVRVEIATVHDRVRPNRIPRLIGTAAALCAATGWEPRIPWPQTVADLIAYERALASGAA